MSYIYGAHMSIAGGFVEALKDADAFGANAMQIFMKSPRGRAKTKLTSEEAEEFRTVYRDLDFKFVVAHCSYLLNFAKKGQKWALESLIDDLRGVEMLGGSGVVLHVGKHLDLEYEEAMKFLIPNLKTVLKETSNLDAKIILENTAGQGTEMGRSFEELAEIQEALGDPRVSICLDTCHSWVWGYDWGDSGAVFEEFDRVLGLESLECIHFNDATKERGSRVDRHANLGDGELGVKSLESIVKFAGENSVPLILETPERGGKTHEDDLAAMREWM